MDNSEETMPLKKKRYCRYCESWNVAPEYCQWIKKKDEHTAFCKLCQTDVSVKYEGSLSLNKHIKTKKHSKMISSQKISQNISNFVVPAENKTEKLIAKAELTSVFHNVVHGLSYNSLDCQIMFFFIK